MDIRPQGNGLALINGMTPAEQKYWQERNRAKHLASKSWNFGGTGGTGGDFGSAWLSGAFDPGNPGLATRDPFKASLDQLVDSSIVMLCIQWIQRTAPEAPLVVAKKKPDRTMGAIIDDHEMSMLIEYPNDYYPGESLWQSTYFSLNTSGNAYWLKVRNGGGHGVPVQLWYEPHFSIRPVSGGNKPGDPLIKGYQLFRDNRWQDLDNGTADVVHFRALGTDPRNPMLGINPLATALREVFTDEQAAIFTAVLLQNMGITNMVINPQKGEILSAKEVIELAQLVKAKTTGVHKGEALVYSTPLDVTYPQMGDTTKISAEAVRIIPQERIPALLGLNRLAVGIGQDGTYSNVGEAREAAVENNLLPTFRILAKQLDNQLLPDFTGKPAKQADLGCFFVTSAMRVLQDDMDTKSVRIRGEYTDGIIKRADAQLELGHEPDTAGDGYKIDVRALAALITAGYSDVVIEYLDPKLADLLSKRPEPPAPKEATPAPAAMPPVPAQDGHKPTDMPVMDAPVPAATNGNGKH